MARGPQRRRALAANLAARKQLNSCMPVPTTHLTACPRLTGRGAGLASKTLQQARALSDKVSHGDAKLDLDLHGAGLCMLHPCIRGMTTGQHELTRNCCSSLGSNIHQTS